MRDDDAGDGDDRTAGHQRPAVTDRSTDAPAVGAAPGTSSVAARRVADSSGLMDRMTGPLPGPEPLPGPGEPAPGPAVPDPGPLEPPRPTPGPSIPEPGPDIPDPSIGEPFPVPGPAPAFVGPAVETRPSLDTHVLLRRRHGTPLHGWRRLVHTASLGTVHPGPGAAETRRAALVRAIQTPILGTHRVAVISLKGGVGKTTTTVMLGSTLASLRGDRVIAVDANPDAGTLGDRLSRQTPATLRDLLTSYSDVRSWGDLAAFTSQARSRLDVIANDVDPAVSTAVTAADYLRVVDLLGRYYSVLLTDSGTGLLHDAMTGILGSADTLVLVSSASIDGARSAGTTLDWLEAQGYGRLVRGAVTVISAVRDTRDVDVEAIARYFDSRCRAVVRIPFDPHLAVGSETDLDALAPRTRAAYLELAGQVAQDFGGGHDPARRRTPSARSLPHPV